MKKLTLLITFACAGLGLTGCGPEKKTATAEKHDDHDGHDHAKETKAKEAKDDHEGHDHAKEEKGHEGEEHVTLKADQQKANRFEFAEAQMRTLGRSIQTTGTVAANEARIARVRPLARGRVLKVQVRVGDAVKKGQEMATFDNIELGEAIGEYRRLIASVDKAKTEAAVTQRAVERAKALVELGGMARSELDKREADAQNAQAVIQEQLAEQSILHEKLHRFGLEDPQIDALAVRQASDLRRTSSVASIRAPQDGIVLKVTTTEGEAIQADSPLFEIVDTSVVWVQADLYDRDLNQVRVGDAATVTLEGYPNEKFAGRVTYIGDTVDPNSRTPKIRCEVANPGRRLKLDMYATIQLPGRGDRQTLMIPNGALQQLEGKTVVFVREAPETFEIRPVKTADESQGWMEIAHGLKAGETVAVRGSFVLRAEHQKAEMGEHGHSHD